MIANPVRGAYRLYSNATVAIDTWRALHLSPATSPRVLFLVQGRRPGGSSDLRGYALARELRRLGWNSLTLNDWQSLRWKTATHLHFKPDIVVFQKARVADHTPDTFPASIRIIDIDDADFIVPERREAAERLVKDCTAGIAGSKFVEQWLRQSMQCTTTIWTGGPNQIVCGAKRFQETYPVVLYASSNPEWYAADLDFTIAGLISLYEMVGPFRFLLMGARHAPRMTELCRGRLPHAITIKVLPFMSYRRAIHAASLADVGWAPLSPDRVAFDAGKSFGKVLMYLSAGLPVVASANGEYIRFFRHGENGLLGTSPDEFASLTASLLHDNDLRQRMAQQGVHDYLAQLTTRKTALQYDAFFRRLLKDGVSK